MNLFKRLFKKEGTVPIKPRLDLHSLLTKEINSFLSFERVTDSLKGGFIPRGEVNKYHLEGISDIDLFSSYFKRPDDYGGSILISKTLAGEIEMVKYILSKGVSNDWIAFSLEKLCLNGGCWVPEMIDTYIPYITSAVFNDVLSEYYLSPGLIERIMRGCLSHGIRLRLHPHIIKAIERNDLDVAKDMFDIALKIEKEETVQKRIK